jgi:hypothetical protein
MLAPSHETRRNLKRVFDKIAANPAISSNNPFLHCEARTYVYINNTRASWHCVTETEKGSLKKAWLLPQNGNSLKYPSDQTTLSPSYHVAPMISLPFGDTTQCIVFDPVFFDEPVCITQWSEAFGATPDMITIADPNVSPNHAHGCGYHHAEVFEHIEPAHLVLWAMADDKATAPIKIQRQKSNGNFAPIQMQATKVGVWCLSF